MRDASWLARWEIRRTLSSYPITLIVGMFFGVLGATILVDMFDGGRGEFISADIYLIFICAALTCNFGSRDSWVSPGTAFPDRVAFFRSLPISAGHVVTSRALSRIPVLIMNIAGVFGVPYLISVLAGEGLAQRLSPVAYLWFTLMWTGYALAAGSWVLYGEVGMHGRDYNRAQFVGFLPLAILVLVMEFVFRPGITARMIPLAENSGPLAAGVALAAGLAVTAVWVVATTRRLARRDLL